MIHINAQLSAHSVIDSYLSNLESTATTQTERDRWANARAMNDQAYFMLIFGIFEQEVNRLCDVLIAHKRGLVRWSNRRLWDTVDLERLGFMRKVALLTERGGSDYRRVAIIYRDIRNKIAHGDHSSVGPIVLPFLANELREIANRFHAK